MALPSPFGEYLKKKYQALKKSFGEARARNFLLGERATTLGGSSLTTPERKEMLHEYMQAELELFGSYTKPQKHGA